MCLLDLLQRILLELFDQLLDVGDSGTGIWHGSTSCVVDEVLDGEEPGTGGNQSLINHLLFVQMMFARSRIHLEGLLIIICS